MTTRRLSAITSILLLVAMITPHVTAQLSKNSRWNRGLKDRYDVSLNVVYSQIDPASDRLDFYVPKDATQPVPVLIWIHGGGWGRLSKDSISGQIIPYLEYGWTVVNVDYRLTGAAPAPAAVQDCRCVLRWIAANAKQLKADLSKIVVSGTSAGGHLSLMTGMLPERVPYDTLCGEERTPRVAAIVNLYGPTDVSDLLDQANKRGFALSWIGNQPNAAAVARAVSPLTYVRKDLPPIITVHGDADPTVPYAHAVRLHAALDSAGVPNEFVTIPGGKHGRFTKEENEMVRERIQQFLIKHKILVLN